MYLSGESLLIILLVGLIAGWLAGNGVFDVSLCQLDSRPMPALILAVSVNRSFC
jgi:hypothetical protein